MEKTENKLNVMICRKLYNVRGGAGGERKSQPSKTAVTTHYFRKITSFSCHSAWHDLAQKSQYFD